MKKRSKPKPQRLRIEAMGQSDVEVAHNLPKFADVVTFLVWNTSDRKKALRIVRDFIKALKAIP